MKLVLVLLLTAFVALTSVGGFAQDAVPDFDPVTNTPAAPPVDEATAEAPINSPTGEPTEVVTDPVIRMTWGQLIFGLISIVGVSLVAGGGLTLVAVRGIVTQLKSNVNIQDLIEKLYNSAPLDSRTRIRTVVDVGKELLDLADTVTDGKPNTPVPTS